MVQKGALCALIRAHIDDLLPRLVKAIACANMTKELAGQY